MTVLLAGEMMAVLRAGQPLRLRGAGKPSGAGAGGVRRTFRAEGVAVSACRTDPDAPTGLFLLEPGPGGRSRAIYHRRGAAGSKFSVAGAEAAWGAGVDLLVLRGIPPALSPGARAATERLLDLARAGGVPVAFLVN